MMSWQEGSEEERRLLVIEGAKKPFTADHSTYLSWLGDESWRVRKEAVTQLSAHADCAQLIPDLIDAMANEDNAGLRNSAFSLLESMGSLAIDPLLARVNTPDEGLRKFIIDLLGQIPVLRVKDTLLAALKDPCINVRLSAVESLGKVGIEEAAPLIIELIAESRDPISLSTSLEALYQLQTALPVELLPKLVGMPLIGPSLVKVLSVSDINTMGKALVNIAISEEYGPTARVAALSCLLPLFERDSLEIPTNSDERSHLAEFLTMLLGSDNHERQILALKLTKYFLNQELLEQALLNAANVTLASYLAPILLSYNQEAIVRATEQWNRYPDASKELLLNTIGRMRILSCRPLLLTILRDESSSQLVLRAAISALGAIGDISTMEVLVPMLNSADENQSQMAAAALQSLCLNLGHESQQVLKTLLVEISPTEVTVELLGNIAESLDVPTLLAWAKNGDSKVRSAALKSLNAFPGMVQLSDLTAALVDEEADIRQHALALVANIKTAEANETLLKAISDPVLPVSLAAIEALKKQPTPKAIETLKNLISSGDTPKAITALTILTSITTDDLPAIIEIACHSSDPEVVKEAMGAMERISAADQQRLLSELLKHSHWSVRLMALQLMMAYNIVISDDMLTQLKASEKDPMVLDMLEEIGG